MYFKHNTISSTKKRLKSLDHLKNKWEAQACKLYTLVHANLFRAEEVTTYTWVKPRIARSF
jgi:hypothetical protein